MSREMLVVGAETGVLLTVAPILRRAGFSVHRIGRADQAPALLTGTRFDLVVARNPMEGLALGDLVSAVRAPGSPCRDSGLLVVAGAGDAGEAEALVGRGVNRVVAEDAPGDRMLDAIADLLGVPPRKTIRAAVQLDLWLRTGQRRVLTVTENLSATGMLVRGGSEFPVGSLLTFELLFPGARPLGGSVVVARHTDRPREHLEGFGGRIIAFSGDGQERLGELLAAR